MEENIFNKNTPGSFYWAGFIAADGNIYEKYANKYVFQLALGVKDVSHIIKFSTFVDYNNKIYSDRTLKRLHIYSNLLCNSLSRFNIVPRKTYIYKMPDWLIQHHLVNHFIRGYVDGDGSFFEHNNRNIGQLVFGVRGTNEFLTQLEMIFRTQVGLKPKLIEISSNWPLLRYEGNGVATKIRDYLYKDSTNKIRLDRKFEFSSKYSYRPYLRRAKAILAYNDEEDISFVSIADAVRKGYVKSSIHQCLKDNERKYRKFKWKYIK